MHMRLMKKILNLDPYSEKDFLLAHKLLTTEIVGQSGKYRNSDVGIFDEQGNMVHLGARPQFIGDLMGELFEWGCRDDTPALVKSCVFHYEIEMITHLKMEMEEWEGYGKMLY